MTSLNYYQKMALIFMLMIRIFSTKTKVYTKLKMSYIRNPRNSVNGLLITGYQFILGKKKQNAFSFLNLCALEHLVRHFDSNASGKSMAIKLSKKLNAKVKYLYRQN